MLVNTYGGFCIVFLCGSPGAGKSYIMTRCIIRRLIESDVRIVTNLPLNVELIAAEVAKRRGCSEEDVAERITLLDKEDLVRWKKPSLEKDGDGKAQRVVHGPWEWDDAFCKDVDLVIDECHIFCPAKGRNVTVMQEAWNEWLGEARHRLFARIVFVTQDEAKVGSAIKDHAELRYELTKADKLRDPFLRISLSDWFELVASFTREYKTIVSIVEYRRKLGKLVLTFSEKLSLDPYWFQFYRSYEAAGGGTGDGHGEKPKREFERRPALLSKRDENGRKIRPVWQWFLLRHWWRFFAASCVVATFAWFFLGGGLRDAPRYVSGWFGAKKNLVAKSRDLAPPGRRSPQLELGSTSPVSAEENANRLTNSNNVANSQLLTALPAVLQKLEGDDRAVVEQALRLASEKLKEKDAQLVQQMAAEAEPEIPEGALPPVSAFIGSNAAMVDGRKVKEGDSIILDGGKRRVRVRKIDRAERAVYLEDSRVLRFAVYEQLPEPGSQPAVGVPTPTTAAVRAGLQSMGQPAEGERSDLKPGQKSIVVRRSNARDGVREAPGGRIGQ